MSIWNKWLLCITCIIFVLSNQLYSFDASITVKNYPASGYLFLAPMGNYSKINCFDHALGRPYEKVFTGNSFAQLFDLKMLPNGNFIGYVSFSNIWLMFDHDFNVIDTISLPYPYSNDFHDIQVEPNGNVLVVSAKNVTVNMQQLVPNGKQNAEVRDIIILEITPQKEINFRWSALEHLNVTDATEDIDLTANYINPFHVNSLFVDNDNNIIISARHLDAIIKINRSTGEIMWRLGGSKSKINQFTINNDTRDNFTGFSHQHHAQRLDNGNLLIFDNGNLKPSEESRAVEYELNETTLTATKVWEYRHTPAIYSGSMGSIQRLYNGNTLIGWGGNDGGEHSYIASEITSDGRTALEIIGDAGIYRAYKYQYKMEFVDKNIDQTGNYIFNDAKNVTGISLNLQYLLGAGKATVEKHHYQPYNIEIRNENACTILPYRWVINSENIDSLYGQFKINLSTINNQYDPAKLKIFIRKTENSGIFSSLPTNYEQSTGTISASISSIGEIMIVADEYFSPELVSPTNNAVSVSVNPTISWNTSKDGETYSFELATDSTFRQLLIDTNDIAINRISISNLNYSYRYYWRVNAYTSSCQSNWSQVNSFTTSIASPELILPVDKSKETATEQLFKWSNVNLASKYKLQISEDPNFSNLTLNIVIQNGTEYRYSNLKNFTTYYWRVAGGDEYFGIWSVVYSFKTIMSEAILRYPANNQKGINPEDKISWMPVPGALYYNVVISSDNQFRNIILDSSGINKTEMKLNSLNTLTTYFWKVKAINDESMSGWSEVWSFKTTMPAPVLQYPQNNSLKQKVTSHLIWGTVAEAESYEILLSDDSTFSEKITPATSGTNSLEFKDLNHSTIYFWKVRAKNKDGQSEWSELYKFKTANIEDIVSPVLSFPANMSSQNNLTLTLQWKAADNVDSYILEVADNSNLVNPILHKEGISGTLAVIENLRFNKDYYWRVTSVKGTILSDWSETWKFTTKLQSTELIQPAPDEANISTNPTFIWRSSDGANYFDIEVSTDIEFNAVIIDKDNISDTTITIEGLNNNTLYYWHIRSKNLNNQSDWSVTGSFQTTNIMTVSIMDNSLEVYPNPSSEQININFDKLIYEPVVFSVFDNTGQLVINKIENVDGTTATIDISGLADGTYYLIINYTFSNRRLKFIKLVR